MARSALKTDRRRLLFVVNVGWFFLSHRLPVARAARDAGFEVHVACDVESAEEVARVEAEGFRFHRLHIRRGSIRPGADLGLLLELQRLYRGLAPYIVHHVTVKPVIYGGLAARLTGVRNVVHAISGLGYAFAQGQGSRVFVRTAILALYRLALRGEHHRVIFQNVTDRDSFLGMRLVRPEACVLIEGSGVDLQRFEPGPESDGTVTVLLPARILRDKGVAEFAEAAARLRADGVAARFAVAGRLDPANPAALSADEFAQLCDRTGIEWLGHVDDMPALLREVHVVCLPSYREGLSKTLIEAAAAGRALVASDVPGCREVVRHGENGWTVPARDPVALAAALRSLIEDRELRERFGRAGRRLAEASWDVREVERRTLDVYRSFDSR
jgi:glycosyltransferase involved in cell wall biosynthesis